MSNSRISNGWKLATSSFTVLKKNKQLLVFPVLSTLSLILLIASFTVVTFVSSGLAIFDQLETGNIAGYLMIFLFYLVNYFIIVFFNMALVHCTRIYFQGEKPTVSQGLHFSISRLGTIFAWAMLSATVGLLLRILEDSLGKIGQIIIALLGIAWSVTTFFVVPVIAYEESNPLAALKRSAEIVKQKWGESLAANFSLGIIQLGIFVLCAIPVAVLASYDFELLALITAGALFGFVIIIFSAVKVIFTTAVYERVANKPIPDFDNQALDAIFVMKEKKKIF